MDESVLVDRVFLRIVSTESDDQFESALDKFLAPALLKLASSNEDVRKKIMELLVHISKRLKSRPNIKLPMQQLILQYKDPSNPTIVTNFSIVYIKLGFPRLSSTEQAAMIPEMLNILQNKPLNQQQDIISLIVPVLKHMVLPADISKRKAMFGLTDQTAARSLLLDFFLDVLFLPYSPYFPPPDGPSVSNTPQCPPCFSEMTYKRISGNGFPSPDQVENMKVGVLTYIAADVFPVQEIALHLIVASADSRHTVATNGENELKKVQSDVDWDDKEVVNKLALTYLGTVTQITKNAVVPKNLQTLPAPSRIKAKLYPYLLKSKMAAQLFPQNIQIACDGMAAPGTNKKLKKFAVLFITNMAETCPQAQLKAIAPTVLSCLWKVIDTADQASADLKPISYATIGKLVRHVPTLVFDNVDVISAMFTRLGAEADSQTKSSIQEALLIMTSSLAKARQDIKDLIEKLLLTSIDSPDDAVRRVSINLAHHVFHTSWLPTRYLLLLACSDPLSDIQTEASKYLHTRRVMEMPIAEYSFELDLYPTFSEICLYINKKKEERLSAGQTYTKGLSTLVFKPETLQQAVVYLRTCLAWSCGIKEPYTTEVSDWTDQTPQLAKYQPLDKQSTLPNKLQRLEADTSADDSVLLYLELLIQTIEIHTSSRNLYLLLEILSLFPAASKTLSKRIDWFKNLVNHHDLLVQSYAAKILAILAFECDEGKPLQLLSDHVQNFKPSLTVEQQNGSLLLMSSLVAYSHPSKATQSSDWKRLTNKLVVLLEPMLKDLGKHNVATQSLSMISTSSPLCLEYGSAEDADEELTAYGLVKTLCSLVKSSKFDTKSREKSALCLGTIGLCDSEFPWRKMCIDGLFECSSTKELELHFSVAEALVMCAQGMDSAERRNKWRQSESEFWESHIISGPNEMKYLVDSVLDQYIGHINPHIKQAACVWLLTIVRKCGKFPEVFNRSDIIQSAFCRLLGDSDEITQDLASKGLGVAYENSKTDQQQNLISDLISTLMTGKSSSKKSGEVSEEAKLFTEGGVGTTLEGQGMNTYRELCAIATDLNQPELIYKFLHLANHQSLWNNRKGAAFGFSTIAAQAGEQLAPYVSQIVPRLYRYTFDPNIKIQNAMRSIWNAVVKETKPTVDKYVRPIMADLQENLTNNQWRVRESCCLAVNDLLRGRQLDDILDLLPNLWTILFRLLDDIKETTRIAATAAANTLSKQTIKVCDINYGKSGEEALSLLLPVLLSHGITSTVLEVRKLSLETVVSISKNSGKFLKPHVDLLIPTLLEALSDLEPQQLNYMALRASGQDEIQQIIDQTRVSISKTSPMMDSINLCIQQVDKDELPNLIPRLIDLIKSAIGLGTKVGVASVISSLCIQNGLEVMQPYSGKLMAALLNAMADRNATVRKTYAVTLANVCKLSKSSSVEKLSERLREWYLEKEDTTVQQSCGLILKAMVVNCPDVLNDHKSRILPLVFLAMHEIAKHATDKAEENVWKQIWSEITTTTDSAVKLYTEELISITDLALKSSSWHMKAQGAAAMGAIAKSAGNGLNERNLGLLVKALLNGLTGRTWNGKEVLLSALTEVVLASGEKLKTLEFDSDKQQIIVTCVKEAAKESLSYKVHAVSCLAKVTQELEADCYEELNKIVLPFIQPEKQTDAEAEDKLTAEFKEVVFSALGNAWPLSKYAASQEKHIPTVCLLLRDIPRVPWKEQLAIWNSLGLIIRRTNLSTMNRLWPDSSQSDFTKSFLAICNQVAAATKYASIKEAICKDVLQLLLNCEEFSTTPSNDVKTIMADFLKVVSSSEISLAAMKTCEEIENRLKNF